MKGPRSTAGSRIEVAVKKAVQGIAVPVSYHLRGATTVREDTDIGRERVSSHGTILVVEDDKALLRLLCKKLEHSSFDIEGVSSGTEALHRIARRPPDLMLLDYYLPDMNGEQLIRTLHKEKRSVPFVVITGQGDEQVAVSMMKLGARDYLIKNATFLDRLPHAVMLIADQLVSEKKLADLESALRESEAAKYAMLDALPDMVFHIRKDGTYVGFAPGADEKRSLHMDMFLGKKIAEVMPPDVADDHMFRIKQALLTGETQVAQYRMALNGLVRDYEARFAASGPEEVLAIVRDITENKQAADMQREVHEYEELNELKTSILSTVSHELRTPLAIIKGYSTMLVDYSDRLGQEEKRDYLGTIDRATDRLTDLVEHLLDMSRLDAGLLRLDKRPTNIKPLLEMTVAEAIVREPNHRLVLRKPVPDIELHIDGYRIRQVVDNLIDNATKYSHQGSGVIVSAEMRQIGSAERRQMGTAERQQKDVMISVVDQGIGIPDANVSKVFDRMYRIEQKMAEDPSGLGLGLALCKALVEAHGGQIWAESTVGRGSTFYFTIPVEADSVTSD